MRVCFFGCFGFVLMVELHKKMSIEFITAEVMMVRATHDTLFCEQSLTTTVSGNKAIIIISPQFISSTTNNEKKGK